MARGTPKTGPTSQLSGYLPGVEYSGLDRVAPGLWEAFERARHDGDATRETLRIPVVGVLEVQSAKVPVPGSEDEPTLALRFIAIEPATDPADVEAVRDLTIKLRKERRGDGPDLEDAGVLAPAGFTDSPGKGDDSQAGTATNGRSRKVSRTLGVVPAPQVFVEP